MLSEIINLFAGMFVSEQPLQSDQEDPEMVKARTEILGQNARESTLVAGCLMNKNTDIVFDLNEKGKLVARKVFEDRSQLPGQRVNKDLQGREIVTIIVEFNDEKGDEQTGYLFATQKATDVVKNSLKDIFNQKSKFRQRQEVYQELVRGLETNCMNEKPVSELTERNNTEENVSIKMIVDGFVLV